MTEQTEPKNVKPKTSEPTPPAIPSGYNLSEDAASASIDLFCPILDEKGNHIGTSRVIVRQSAQLAGVALELLVSQMDHFLTLGFSPVSPATPRPVQANAPAAPGVPPSTPGSVPPPLPPGGSVPAGSVPPAAPGIPAGSPPPHSEPEEGVWNSDRFQVTPLPGGCAKIEFFQTGKNAPILKINKWKIENVVKKFREGTGQDWTDAHFQTAEVYTIPLAVSWKLGRDTGYGNRFRDVTGIAVR